MNKQLQQLAYRNIKKYRKHYLFVSILIFCVSLFFLSYTMIFNNQYEAEKLYNQEKYGEWYYKADLQSVDEKDLIGVEGKTFHSTYRYSFIHYQGMYEDSYKIGFAEEDMYDFARLVLKDGDYPESDNEIMISTKLQKEKKLSINDTISLVINSEVKDYKIAGIIENSQDNIFPDVYTNIEYAEKIEVYTNQELNRDFTRYRPYDPNVHALVENVEINQFGYIGTPTGGELSYTIEQIIVLVEVIFLLVFALIALNITSLKRRNKEFALLRGIGMTNKQLFSMIFYEILYTTLVSILIAFVLSFGVSYLGSILLEFKYGYYIYNINLLQVLSYFVSLVVIILLAMIYPIHSSSKNSLSGTFDSQKFQYIQVRYRKLKYQNKWRLALRELNVDKKIMICLFGLLGLISSLFITSRFNTDTLDRIDTKRDEFRSFHYYQMWTQNIEDYEMILDKYKDNCHTFTVNSISSKVTYNGLEGDIRGNVIPIEDKEIFDNCVIEGRLPENDYEILLGNYSVDICRTIMIEPNLFEEETIGSITLGDSFEFNNQTYTVVGYLEPNESVFVDLAFSVDLYYAPMGVYVTQNTYNLLCEDKSYEETLLRIYFENREDRQVVYRDINEVNSNNYYEYSDSELEQAVNMTADYTDIFIEIDSKYLILPILVSFIFLYYLYKNNLINYSQNIALLKLIGITNRELMFKQLCKALIISGFVIAFEVFWIFMLNLYYNVVFIPVIELLFSVIVVVIITIFIYCYPMKGILKNNVFDLIKGEE